jgi:Transposase DDE domain
MSMIDKVAATLQSVLGTSRDVLGREMGIIKRLRKFSGASLFNTMVLTVWKSPAPNTLDFVVTAAQLGVVVTPEAIEKRFTDELIPFLREGLKQVMETMIAAEPCAIALLDKFTTVEIGDSTTVTIPDEYAAEFPGCGGKSASGKAAVKIQADWELRAGKLTRLSVEPGRLPDAKTKALEEPVAAGALVIRDLGYFSLKSFQKQSAEGAYWISRLQPGTAVFDPEGRPLNLLEHLRRHRGNAAIDMPILVGAGERLRCRLIVLRVPQEMADRRRQKAYERAQKHGRTPSEEYLELCQWTIFVTNCPVPLLTWKEVVILYRARWQIELMFKLWKSHNHLAAYRAEWSPVKRMALFWAKLIAVILQHWLLLTSTWADPRRSHWKAAQFVRQWIDMVIATLGNLDGLIDVLERMTAAMGKVARKKIQQRCPSLFQLLFDPELLEWNS